MGSVVKLNTAEGAFKALDACHRDIAAHLDRLAKQGLRFTQAYAACPVCSSA